MHRTRKRIAHLLGPIRRHFARVRVEARSDAGFTAFEWAVGLALTGSLILVVYAAANTKIAEKVAQIAGF
ncbi:hypothetical protein [Streptomyces sp. NPDC007205]|uniref:hypothetical protein n=1 Tax=unclassified Streptomyces TaxID=2593676 RepID=UPI0033CFC61A